MRVAIPGRPEPVSALYGRPAELRLTLATEVVSPLGVSVGFSDTDGDTLRKEQLLLVRLFPIGSRTGVDSWSGQN